MVWRSGTLWVEPSVAEAMPPRVAVTVHVVTDSRAQPRDSSNQTVPEMAPLADLRPMREMAVLEWRRRRPVMGISVQVAPARLAVPLWEQEPDMARSPTTGMENLDSKGQTAPEATGWVGVAGMVPSLRSWVTLALLKKALTGAAASGTCLTMSARRASKAGVAARRPVSSRSKRNSRPR